MDTTDVWGCVRVLEGSAARAPGCRDYAPRGLCHSQLRTSLAGVGCVLLIVVTGDVDVGDLDVDLDDVESGALFDGTDDITADRLGDVDDRGSVLGDDGEVDRCLLLALFDGDSAGELVCEPGIRSVRVSKARRAALPML